MHIIHTTTIAMLHAARPCTLRCGEFSHHSLEGRCPHATLLSCSLPRLLPRDSDHGNGSDGHAWTLAVCPGALPLRSRSMARRGGTTLPSSVFCLFLVNAMYSRDALRRITLARSSGRIRTVSDFACIDVWQVLRMIPPDELSS